MDITVKVEEPTKVSRKLTITVPPERIDRAINGRLVDAQKKAKIKGFRPGKVPMDIVRQYYGEDIKHRVLSQVISDSYREALTTHDIRAVGQPQIQQPSGNQLQIKDGEGITFTATVDVMPQVELKSYEGFSLKKDKVKIDAKEIDKVLESVRDRHADLVPIKKDRAVQKTKDFVDFDFKGGLVSESGVEEYEGMSGNRTVEMGMGELIPGFEVEMTGMKPTEEKTFRIKFPEEYMDKNVAGKEAEFYIKVNEIKEKQLPELNDDLAKLAGADDLNALRKRIEENLTQNKAQESEDKLRNELLQKLIDKNPFAVPGSFIEAQSQRLTQEFVQMLKQQGYQDNMIQDALKKEQGNIRKRAENQVRSGLLLEEIAKKQKIEVSKDHREEEYKRQAESMKMEIDKVKEYYESKPENLENLDFRLKEDLTVKYLLSQSKIK